MAGQTETMDESYGGCGEEEFLCRNDRCIHKDWFCDGVNDCNDEDEELWIPSSDETNCRSANSNSNDNFGSSSSKASGSQTIGIIVGIVILILLLLILLAILLRRYRQGRSQESRPGECQQGAPQAQFHLVSSSNSASALNHPQPTAQSSNTQPDDPILAPMWTYPTVVVADGNQTTYPGPVGASPVTLPVETVPPDNQERWRPQADVSDLTVPPPSYEEVMASEKK